MNKPDKNQKIKLNRQTSLRSSAEKAENRDRAYKKLITSFNRLGYFPKTRAESERIAKELLDQGRED